MALLMRLATACRCATSEWFSAIGDTRRSDRFGLYKISCGLEFIYFSHYREGHQDRELPSLPQDTLVLRPDGR